MLWTLRMKYNMLGKKKKTEREIYYLHRKEITQY